MELWEREVVFALDVEMVTAVFGGKRTAIAARVVLMKTDLRTGTRKVLDTYVRNEKAVIVDYNTRYSRIESWMVDEGVDVDFVSSFILQAIRGHTLVTFNGHADFAALGLDENTIKTFAKKYVELQDYFRRPDGQPYGLGPLVHYFGYERHGRPVLINHHIIDDTFYTLRLYLDHYVANDTFYPTKAILTTKQFRNTFRL